MLLFYHRQPRQNYQGVDFLLRLRPYKKCDAQYIVNWFNDERAFRKWSADRYDRYPITADDLNEKYEESAFEDGFYPMTAFNEDGIVGHMIMRFTNEEKTDLRFGFIVVDSKKRGMGYGKKMLCCALKYAFELLGAQRVTLGVFDNNESAYMCYRSIGFGEVIENGQPVCENVKIMGEDWVVIEMEIFKGE